jgi:hypothetical protein
VLDVASEDQPVKDGTYSMSLRGLFVLGLSLAVSALPACGFAEDTEASEEALTPAGDVWLALGEGVSDAARNRLEAHLTRAAKAGGAKLTLAKEAKRLSSQVGANDLVIAIGGSEIARQLVPGNDPKLKKLAPEGYVVRSGKFGAAGATLLVADGRAMDATGAHAHARSQNLGVLHGAYALLEELGYAFLHPLAPTVPERLFLPKAAIDIASSPRWAKRELHLHTQHPLELTDMLQGFGPGGPSDASGFERSLDEWDRYLEWLVANGQNGVEWFLLWADAWKEFADSDERIARLAVLVDRAHAVGINVGLDAPVTFTQQHAFRLLRPEEMGDEAKEHLAIRNRLDRLMRAKFDFWGLEGGTSEFTSGDPKRALGWMNEVTKHLDEKYDHTKTFIKVHVPIKEAEVDGQKLNINMLPRLADPRLGVLPHTIQHYGLSDPAPTYGVENFGHIHDFIRSESGKRPLVYYPETAYWVSFDVDVPLFLPLYADRRLSDLRMIAKDEADKRMAPMDGQLIFPADGSGATG